MKIKMSFLVIFSFFQSCFGQPTSGVSNRETIDTAVAILSNATNYNTIYNTQAINHFYQKLAQLDRKKDNKIRITQIGDSHIQADFFSGKTRTLLQERFGNSGLGYTFPYSLAKTNSNSFIKYTANTTFATSRIVSAEFSKNMGLSGISFETTNSNFVLELQVKNAQYAFTSIKMLTPNEEHLADFALASKEIKIEKPQPKVISHKIKSGEALSTIAQKYNTTVSTLKQYNGLKSNTIRAGKTLKIPTQKTENQTISKKEFIPLNSYFDGSGYVYDSAHLLDKIFIFSSENKNNFALNGLILENNNPGIIYNAIGVNGAKAVDFNKESRFFKQLLALQSDLFIISLGTNESFDKLDVATFYSEFTKMLENIRHENPNAEILVTTPPPSLWNKKYPNTLVQDYTEKIIANAETNNYAVWNLYEAMGGLENINKNSANNIIYKDKVHYTVEGYEWQGKLFYKALLNSYESLHD